VRGQWNDSPLTPQDRFSIGNRYTVRGFDGQLTLAADRGWLIRSDLSAPIAHSGQVIYIGADYGEVGGQSSENLIGKYLAGVVAGLRGGYKSLQYDVFVGEPVNKPKGYQTHATTAGFSLNWTY
jgi:hemolysin activation/secretion protein